MVKILGAGLAGLSSAIVLAKNGYGVEITEKSESVGTVVDDVQAIRNYEGGGDQLDIFAQEGVILKHANPIHKIVKYAPSRRSMTVHSEISKPIFYTFQRGTHKQSIEMQLYHQAVKLGVNFNFNQTENFYETNAEIISTGPLHNNIWAFGAVYSVSDIDPETILFFMDNNYCPKGYIYLLPYGKKEITIAATTFDTKCKLPSLFSKFLQETPIIKNIIKDAKFLRYTSGYSYSNLPNSAEIKGRKIIGSAAGFLDPARGFGIKYAILSGILAAKSIINNVSYDKLWKDAFGKELQDGLKRRFLLEKMENEDYEKLILNDKISIHKYEKVPSLLRDKVLKIQYLWESEKFRKEYSLDKIKLNN